MICEGANSTTKNIAKITNLGDHVGELLEAIPDDPGVLLDEPVTGYRLTSLRR